MAEKALFWNWSDCDDRKNIVLRAQRRSSQLLNSFEVSLGTFTDVNNIKFTEALLEITVAFFRF